MKVFHLCLHFRDLRAPRFSILELMIIVAIFGLVCSVPIQYQRDFNREVCRFLARQRADWAEELTLMAEYPATWMDPFRPELRQRAAWEREDSRRFSESVFYNAAEFERVSRRNSALRKDRQFWAQFNKVAAQHGFKRPRVNPGAQQIWGIDGFLLRSFPTYLALIVLVWTLCVTRRSRRRQIA
jgi:hypothetical protein